MISVNHGDQATAALEGLNTFVASLSMPEIPNWGVTFHQLAICGIIADGENYCGRLLLSPFVVGERSSYSARRNVFELKRDPRLSNNNDLLSWVFGDTTLDNSSRPDGSLKSSSAFGLLYKRAFWLYSKQLAHSFGREGKVSRNGKEHVKISERLVSLRSSEDRSDHRVDCLFLCGFSSGKFMFFLRNFQLLKRLLPCSSWSVLVSYDTLPRQREPSST